MMDYTTLIQRAATIKVKHHDSIVLLRYEDYYWAFDEDALTLSKVLDTPIINGLNRFKYNELDNYLPKIVRTGHKVVICDIVKL